MPQPRTKRYRGRYQARLDAETHARLEALTQTFHKKRAPILRHMLQWGLTHSQDWTIDPSNPASVSLVHVLVEPVLMEQVQEAAARHGASVAGWLRQALRQVTLEDFPANWRAEGAVSANHVHGFGRFNVQNLSSLSGMQRVECPRYIRACQRQP